MEANSPNNLCLECGFCCNGVIFADVKLQRGDDASRLRTLGLAISANRFRQPCVAWRDCRCSIYDQRPEYCRQFECLLLKNVQEGRVTFPRASHIIGSAKSQVENVMRLLRALGNNDEALSLKARFQQITKLLETETSNDEIASLYSELTLAYHDLNQLLRESFYDG